MATYSDVQTRAAALIDETTASTALKNHILASVRDIVNFHPFSWTITTTTLSLSSGSANLPTDFNPKWGLHSAQIENTGNANDNIFQRILPGDRDAYATTDYVYWLTWNTTTSRWIFNSKTQSGTVCIYYYFLPTDMSANSDTLIVPDMEAVAYFAAAKNYMTDERNKALKDDYMDEARGRIEDLKRTDQAFADELLLQQSIVGVNPRLTGGSINAFKTTAN